MINYVCVDVHTIAMLKGGEQYTRMREGLAPVWEEINKLIDDKVVKVNGQDIPVQFYLGGDYKVWPDLLTQFS